MATVFVFYFLQWQKKDSIQQADVSALSKEKTQTLKGKNSVKHRLINKMTIKYIEVKIIM